VQAHLHHGSELLLQQSLWREALDQLADFAVSRAA
jgi:hypothetical protein